MNGGTAVEKCMGKSFCTMETVDYARKRCFFTRRCTLD